MKPREFWIKKTKHYVQGQLYAVVDGIEEVPFEGAIHVREVMPIDWEKVWREYNIKNPREPHYPTQELQIQQLVEKQLAGEE